MANFFRNAFCQSRDTVFVDNEVVCRFFSAELFFYDACDAVVIDGFSGNDLVGYLCRNFIDAGFVEHNFTGLFRAVCQLFSNHACKKFVVHCGSANLRCNHIRKAFVVNLFGCGKGFDNLFSCAADNSIVIDLRFYRKDGRGFFTLDLMKKFKHLIAYFFYDTAVIYVFCRGQRRNRVYHLTAVRSCGFFRLCGNGFNQLCKIIFRRNVYKLVVDVGNHRLNRFEFGIHFVAHHQTDGVKLGIYFVCYDCLRRIAYGLQVHVTVFQFVEVVKENLKLFQSRKHFLYRIQSFADFLGQHGSKTVVDRLVLLIAKTNLLRDRAVRIFQIAVYAVDLCGCHAHFRQQRISRLL